MNIFGYLKQILIFFLYMIFLSHLFPTKHLKLPVMAKNYTKKPKPSAQEGEGGVKK